MDSGVLPRIVLEVVLLSLIFYRIDISIVEVEYISLYTFSDGEQLCFLISLSIFVQPRHCHQLYIYSYNVFWRSISKCMPTRLVKKGDLTCGNGLVWQ